MWSGNATVTIDIVEKDMCSLSRVWQCHTKLLQDPINKSMLSQHLLEFFQIQAPTAADSFSL